MRTIISYITGQLAIAAPFICRGCSPRAHVQRRKRRSRRASRSRKATHHCCAACHDAESNPHMRCARADHSSVPASPHPSHRAKNGDAARAPHERDPAPALSRGERRRRQQSGWWWTARSAAACSTFRRHGLWAILCRRPRRNWWRLARLEGRARGRAALVGGVRRAGAGGLRLHPLPPAHRRLRATLRGVRRRRRVPRLSWVRS